MKKMNKITTIVLVLFVLFFVGCGDEVTQIQNTENLKKSVEFEFTVSPILYSDHNVNYISLQLSGQSNLNNFYNADIFLKKGNDLCYIDSSDINEGRIAISLYNIQEYLGYAYIYEDLQFVLKLNSFIDVTWEVLESDLIIDTIFYEDSNDDYIFYNPNEKLLNYNDYYESFTFDNPYNTENNNFSLEYIKLKLRSNADYIVYISNQEFSNEEDDILGDLLGDLIGEDENIYTFSDDFQSDEDGNIQIYPNLNFNYKVVIKVYDKEKEEFVKQFEILESQIYEKEMDAYFVNPW